jgi:hypothetical protein
MIDYKVNSNSSRREARSSVIICGWQELYMTSRVAVLVTILAAICWGQQPQGSVPAPVRSAPAAAPAPVVHFATVTAVTRDSLDTKSCASEKEFRSAITSPFIFNGQPIEQGAELVGHIQACNRDLAGKQLEMAAVVIDAIALPNKGTIPVLAVLQALGPPLPPSRITPTGSDIGYVSSMEFHQDTRINSAAQGEGDVTEVARRGATNVGVLNRLSSGVVALKHISFENTGVGKSLLWVFVTENESLEIRRESQLVVRFSIAPPAAPHANKQ